MVRQAKRCRLTLAVMVAVGSGYLAPVDALRAAAGRGPNIILINTDDHAQWALGAYGNKEIHTPNMDRLA